MNSQPHHIGSARPHNAFLHPRGISPLLHQSGAPETLVYVGLAAIAKAMGAGPNTIKRWIREEAFPVRRCSDGIYRATAQGMLQWFQPPPPAQETPLAPHAQTTEMVRQTRPH